jgi:uncharacterized protein (TIGR00730 family)
MARLCVFCGSRPGRDPIFLQAARELGARLVARRVGLVYGGASVGVMGTLADAVLAGGGHVIGVIPHGVFQREIAHTALTELHVVRSMHERKAMMTQKSDAFLALPGGLGTFDELFEAMTWAQIGIHDKPIGVLDVGGYFEPFQQLVARAKVDGFLDEAPLRIVTASIDEALDALLPVS